jgi:hypothetical protein
MYSPAGLLRLVARPEFARNIGAGLSLDCETCGCCTAACMEGCLRDGTCCCMPGEFTHSRTTLTGFRVVSYHRTRQRMPEPVAKAPLG